MTICTDLADYEWLTGSEAGALLEELAAVETPLHTTVARLRGRFTPNQTHLLMEQAELRRRATAKFTQAQRMFFTRVGLEQATDEWVAGYKASRFEAQHIRGRGRPGSLPDVADLCCGIGGDLTALAAQGAVIGVDHDGVAAHFAAINSRGVVQTIDVGDFDFDTVAAWHIDPDRRPAGRRTTSIEWCEPNRAAIERMLKQVPHGAVKLAPATDVPIEWTASCELEWISRDRECRQLVAWHGDLALAPGQHRATVLSSVPGSEVRTLIGQPKQPVSIADKPDHFVFDIDPAVLAAKLKGVLAAEQRLYALSSGPTYFTGPRALFDSTLACFEVDDVMPFHANKMVRWLRARNIGTLEIKNRGVDVDPEKLRRELKLRGNNAATLLITRVAARPIAILAHRVET